MKKMTVYAVKVENGTEIYFKDAKTAKYYANQSDYRVYMGKRIRSETDAWYMK
jgi:hypothetical protein